MYAPPAQAVQWPSHQPASLLSARPAGPVTFGPSAERDRGPRKRRRDRCRCPRRTRPASHRAERPHLTRPGPGQRVNGPASNRCRPPPAAHRPPGRAVDAVQPIQPTPDKDPPDRQGQHPGPRPARRPSQQIPLLKFSRPGAETTNEAASRGPQIAVFEEAPPPPGDRAPRPPHLTASQPRALRSHPLGHEYKADPSTFEPVLALSWPVNTQPELPGLWPPHPAE